jgi:hypothetical protein
LPEEFNTYSQSTRKRIDRAFTVLVSDNVQIHIKTDGSDPPRTQKLYETGSVADPGCYRILDPNFSASKILSIFNSKNCYQAPGKMICDVHPGYRLFSIPDPMVKKAPDPGSGSATLETGIFLYVRYGMEYMQHRSIISYL